MKGGYKESKTAPREVIAHLLRQYSKTQGLLEKYLKHFKRVVRDRSMFEDNQVDPAALEAAIEVFMAPDPVAEGTTAALDEDEVGVELALPTPFSC